PPRPSPTSRFSIVAPLFPVVSLSRNLNSYWKYPFTAGYTTFIDCCSITSWAAVVSAGVAGGRLGGVGDGRDTWLGAAGVGLPLHPAELWRTAMNTNMPGTRIVASCPGDARWCGSLAVFGLVIQARISGENRHAVDPNQENVWWRGGTIAGRSLTVNHGGHKERTESLAVR